MPSIERTAYPRLCEPITPADLQRDFTPTDEEKLFAINSARKASHRLGVLVLLKVFLRLRRFPPPEEIPPSVVQFARIHLGFSENILMPYHERKLWFRHCQAIRRYLDVKSYYGKEARHTAVRFAAEAALTMSQQTDILNAVMDGLIYARFELPAYSGLDRVVERVQAVIHRRLFARVFARLSSVQRTALDQLLVIGLDERQTALQAIKQRPRRASRKNLDESIEHLEWLESLVAVENVLKDAAPSLIRDFGRQARTLDAAELKKVAPERRCTFLLCLIHSMQVRGRDSVATMYVKRMATVHKRAKDDLVEQQLQQQERVERLVTQYEGVLGVLARETTDTRTGREVRALFGSHQEIESAQSECLTVKSWTGSNYLPLLWDHHKHHRSVLFEALKALKLESATEDSALLDALALVREHQHSRGDWIPRGKLLLPFASPRWLKLIQHPEDPGQWNRRHLEVCVLSEIAEQLEAGNLCVAGSDSYGDYRQQLLSWEECEQRLPEYCARIGLPATAEEFVSELERQLREKAEAVDRGFPDNADVTIGKDGLPVLRKSPAQQITETALRLEAEFAVRMPRRTLLEILVNIQHLTSFTRHFGPGSGAEPKLRAATERYLLTVFAMGSNLGPVQAARHLAGMVTAHMLSFTNQRHVTVEKLDAARAELIELYLMLDLPKTWGNGQTVAADGTQFDFYDNNLTVGYHFRYRKLGAVAYRHVADNYIAVFCHFIPPGIWEAVYVIEGLMKQPVSMRAANVCGDTQAQAATVFAFTHLSGIHLLPRIRNWKDLKLSRPGGKRYRHIDGLFGEKADWKLIRTHWKDLMQVALSIQAGKISSAALLRRLGSENRQSKLYLAAHALGRVVRTLFLLDWISNAPLRQAVTATTNKVECYHGFVKWLSFGGEVIAENDPDEQQKQIRYTDLLAAAVILQNAIDMERIIEDLKREGWEITDADLASFSPYLTPGIQRFGEYRLDMNRPVEACIAEARKRWRGGAGAAVEPLPAQKAMEA